MQQVAPPASRANIARTAPPPKPPSTVSRLLKSTLWSVAVVAVSIGLLEALFAVAHIGEDQADQPVPIIGFSHVPNRHIVWRDEGYSESSINSAGYRDVEWSLAKPAGTTRIALLGDSMTESFQVPLESTFGKLIEKRLNSSGRPTEVMNFGVSGFSTVQELYQFKSVIAKYHPDVCVVAYHIGDSEKNIVTRDTGGMLPRPYCTIDGAGNLITDWSAYDNWQRNDSANFKRTEWLRNNSRIWAVCTKLDLELCTNKLYKQARAVVTKLTSSLLAKFDGSKQPAQPLQTANTPRITNTATDILGSKLAPTSLPTTIPQQPSNAVLTDPYAASWRLTLIGNEERFKVTAHLLHIMNAACKAEHCKLVVTGLPAPSNSIAYFKQLQAIKNLASQDGFAFVDTAKAFPPIAPMESSRYFYNVHFTPDGHKLVADSLYDALWRPADLI